MLITTTQIHVLFTLVLLLLHFSLPATTLAILGGLGAIEVKDKVNGMRLGASFSTCAPSMSLQNTT